MERDPVQLVWRYDRAGHLLASALGLIAIPAAFIVIDLPRRAVDALASGRTAFLDLALPGPYADEPIVLSTGVILPPATFILALALLACGAFVVRGLARLVLNLWRRRRAAALAADLSGRIMAALAHARTSDGADLVGLARESAHAVRQIEPFLRQALTMPGMAVTRIVIAVAYAAWIDARIGAAAALISLAVTAVSRGGSSAELHERRRAQRDTSRLVALHEALARQFAAMRVHGTAEDELSRLRNAERSLWQTSGIAIAMMRSGRMVLTDSAVLLAPLAAAALQVTIGGSPGQVIGAAVAFALLPKPLARLTQWQEERAAAALQLGLVADALRTLKARVGAEGAAGQRPQGEADLQANDLKVLDDSGQVVGPLSLSLAPGTHAALVGRPGDVSTAMEALAGLRPLLSGQISVGGTDPYGLTARERAALIAVAPAEPMLVTGTLERNVTYGQNEVTRSAMSMANLAAALDAAGLKAYVRAQAQAAPIDIQLHPELAAAIPQARRAVREALEAQQLEHLVDPFQQDRYNAHATLAENILFGEPVGDTFGEENLARHPFLRAVLDAEELTNDLVAMGLSIARSTTEMFAGVPEGSPLFDRFAFMAWQEREEYEDIVARQGIRRRGAEASRDRERLISLALRYVEPRHRLGLIDPALADRLLHARRTFAELLPVSLRPSVDFYRADAVCRAASLADNLLFGRIAYDVAGAREAVSAIVDRVIADNGLTDAVLRLGLSTPLELSLRADRAFSMSVELARVLLRGAPIIMAVDPVAGLTEPEAKKRLSELRAALTGRTFIAGLSATEGYDGAFSLIVPVDQAVRARQ